MSNRKSNLGKLYDTIQKEFDDNAWVRELVENIKTDLTYSIQVEEQKLPISCLMEKSKVHNLTDNEVYSVVKVLRQEGILVDYVNLIEYSYFKVMELL